MAAGVKHVIYTSAINAAPDSASICLRDHYESEQAVIASGLTYTILRNTLYVDSLLMRLPQLLNSGQWFHSAANGRIALITREDCARVASAALVSDFNDHRIIEVSGLELMDHVKMASIISDLSGKPLASISIDEASLVEAIIWAGVPEFFSRLLATFDTAQAGGEFDVLTSAVRDFTGNEPRSIRSFLADHISHH